MRSDREVLIVQICQKIKELRKEKGLSQKEVAEKLGTVQRQYIRYENGERELPLHHFIALAKFYGVTLDYLAGISDER